MAIDREYPRDKIPESPPDITRLIIDSEANPPRQRKPFLSWATENAHPTQADNTPDRNRPRNQALDNTWQINDGSEGEEPIDVCKTGNELQGQNLDSSEIISRESRDRTLLATDSSSATEMYHFQGDRETDPFIYYTQAIDAKHPSPVWEDILPAVADPDLRIAMMLLNEKVVWTCNKFKMQHSMLARIVASSEDTLHARVSITNGFSSSGKPYHVQVLLGLFTDDTREQATERSKTIAGYLQKNLEPMQDQTSLKIEYADKKLETLFSGSLVEYETAREQE